MNCFEGEYVGVLISYNLDENDEVLATKLDFMGNYEQYQKIKNSYAQNQNVFAENIPWNGYIIR